jgi:hypothetical protein
MTLNTDDLQREWTERYHRSRYLREVPSLALTQRYDNLIQNLWSTDREGKVQKGRNADHHRTILQLLFDIILERIERNIPPANGMFDEQAMINEATASYTPPLLKSPIVGGPDGFAKFGMREHIRPSFERGIFLIKPASSYDDPSLNAAQADKELEHFTVTPNQQLLFRLHGIDASGNRTAINHEPLELFRYMNVPDFYVWCCGLGCDLRMLHDFQYDALLLVKDITAFTKRMLEAIEKIIPTSTSIHRPVRYYDPYTVQRNQLTPIFSKNLRYLYQNEYRFAWRIPAGEAPTAFFVELGPLDDIAQYYETV